MSELENSSRALEKNAAAAATSLLANYSFDLGGYRASELVERWLEVYPANWVRLAVIEALYQGRYKAISVDQILTIWLRRQQPLYHFKYEFERLVCNKLPPELQELFFSSSAELPAGYPQPHRDMADISDRGNSDPSGELQSEETLSSSISVEELAELVVEEPIVKPSIPVAQVKPTHKNSDQRPGEVKLMLPQFDRLSDRPNFTPSEPQSPPELVTFDFSDFTNWGLGYPPIDQFIPDPPFPDFHTKLKSFTEP